MKQTLRKHGWMFFALLAAVSLSSAARADVMLVDKNVMVTAPSVPKIDALTLSGPGTLTVTVWDMTWPQALQSLSFAITNDSTVLKSSSVAGTLTYDVLGPVTLFSNVYGVPDEAAGSGLFHIKASFVSAVPLPAAAWLLLSGLAGLSRMGRVGRIKPNQKSNPTSPRRKHAAVTNFIVQ